MGLGSQRLIYPVRFLKKKVTIDPAAFKVCGTVPIILFPALPITKFYNIVDVFCACKLGPLAEQFTFDPFNSSPVITFDTVPAGNGIELDAAFINGVEAASYITGCKGKDQALGVALQPNGCAMILTTMDGNDSPTGDTKTDLYIVYTIENAKT